MKPKLGPPQPGTARPLTKGEAAVLGCAASWHIGMFSDGAWLLKPYRRAEWSGPGPRLAAIQLPESAQRRMRRALEQYWGIFREVA